MLLDLHIRDNETSEIRIYDFGDGYGDVGAVDFAFSEGNYSCDCNRGHFFNRANGADEATVCGHDRYAVKITDRVSDALIYVDDGWDS